MQVRSKLAEFLHAPIRQHALLRFFQGVQTLLTTSHVIVELQYLTRSRLELRGSHQQAFWSMAVDRLKERGFDERLITLLTVAGKADLWPSVGEIGITDASLIELARETGCALITEDVRTLHPRAVGSSVDCRLLAKLLGPD